MAEAPKALKDAKLQQYYDSLFEMHGSEGWASMQEDFAIMEARYNRVDAVDADHSLDFRRGQLDILRWLLAHKELVERAYTHILEEEAGEAPEPTGGAAKVIA